MENQLRCKECFYFKTIEINTNNLFQLNLVDSTEIFKKILESRFGFVQVWYCKEKLLPQAIYFNQRYASDLVNLNCEKRDV